MYNIVIVGAGGFAREVQWLLESGPYMCVNGFLTDDESKWGSTLSRVPILGNIENVSTLIKEKNMEAICGVGSPRLKKRFVERVIAAGLRFSPYVRDISTRIDSFSNIGKGTVICANSSITCNVDIRNHVNINLNCTVGHDSTIEDYCNLSPGVHISGNVYLETGVDVGTGAVILPGVRIGAWATVGAGAVVTKDVAPGTTVVGIPAKELKKI